MSLNYRIQELREAAHMSREELAKAAGCTRATIYLLENGSNNTTTKTLIGIATALNVEVKDLFYPHGV